jgi:hypothetical protein
MNGDSSICAQLLCVIAKYGAPRRDIERFRAPNPQLLPQDGFIRSTMSGDEAVALCASLKIAKSVRACAARSTCLAGRGHRAQASLICG